MQAIYANILPMAMQAIYIKRLSLAMQAVYTNRLSVIQSRLSELGTSTNGYGERQKNSNKVDC